MYEDNIDSNELFSKLTFDESKHSFVSRYDIIHLADDYGQLSNIFNDVYFVCGACGIGTVEKLLNEELCSYYNLNCSRW